MRCARSDKRPDRTAAQALPPGALIRSVSGDTCCHTARLRRPAGRGFARDSRRGKDPWAELTADPSRSEVSRNRLDQQTCFRPLQRRLSGSACLSARDRGDTLCGGGFDAHDSHCSVHDRRNAVRILLLILLLTPLFIPEAYADDLTAQAADVFGADSMAQGLTPEERAVSYGIPFKTGWNRSFGQGSLLFPGFWVSYFCAHSPARSAHRKRRGS